MTFGTQTDTIDVEPPGATVISIFEATGLAGGGIATYLARTPSGQLNSFLLEIFDANGDQIGTQINLRDLADFEASNQNFFRIMGLSDGNILITYSKNDAHPSNAGTDQGYFFVIDQQGNKVVNDTAINAGYGPNGLTRSIDLVELENGNIAFSFASSDGFSHRTRVFTPDGQPVSAETIVYTNYGTSNTSNLNTSIAAGKDGGYLVTYAYLESGVRKIDFKIYSAGGVEQSAGNAYTGSGSVFIEATALANGNYLITHRPNENTQVSSHAILNSSGQVLADGSGQINGGGPGRVVAVTNSDGTTGFLTVSFTGVPSSPTGEAKATLHYYSDNGTLISSAPDVAVVPFVTGRAPVMQLYAGYDQGSALLIRDKGIANDNETLKAVIFDQPASPTVTLSTDTASINEAAGVATITATISQAALTDTIVTLKLEGTATGGGTDYTAASPTITILAGQLTGTTTLTAVQDLLDENDETILVGIQSVSGGDNARAGTGQVTVSIIDDDAPPTVSIAPSSVVEGNSGFRLMVFDVSLSAASGKGITVIYRTANQTAISGSDYLQTTGSIIFAPGETSKQVSIRVNGDTVVEGDETFTVTLTQSINATLGNAVAIGTIIDDENTAPTLATPTPIALTDTSAADTFANVTGSINASDADGISSYGITGAVAVNELIGGLSYDLSRAGTYGTLYVASSTGDYVYVPNAAAINALDAGPQSESFTVSATDAHASPATGTASLVINVTGANDAPTALSLSHASVNQSSGVDAVVGSLGTTDPEAGQTHTYSLVAGNGINDLHNASFSIAGSSLRANDASALAAGTYNIFVRTSDGQGGTYDRAFTITVADDLPPTTSVTAIHFNDSGASAFDNITNVAVQTVTATLSQGLATGERVLASINGGASWTDVTSSVDGTSVTWTGATFLPGSHELQLKVVDAANNDGPVGKRSYELDTTSPADPVITSAAQTNNAKPVISGTAEAGSRITLTVGSATFTTTATGGNWSVDLSSASPSNGTLTLDEDGDNAVSVTAKDVAGNESQQATQTLVIDSVAPLAPAITSAALTNDAEPVISGTAEAGSMVTLVVGGATYTTTATGGSWSIDLSTANPTQGSLVLDTNGDNPVVVTATDAAGNESQEGTQTLAIDTTEPPSPVITSAELTDDPAPVITGTAETGARVTVVVGGATYEVTATDGTWTLDLATAQSIEGTLALNPNGDNPISATATDAAGNASEAGTQTLVIDTVPPSAPVVTSPASTNNTAPVITGTAEADAKVTVEVGGATYVVTATNGAWTLDLATVSPTDGALSLDVNGDNPISVTATDAAGNDSTEGTQTLVIDTTPPAAPAVTSASLTKDETPVISGTAEADATVILIIGGATYTTIATGGTWSIDLSTAEPIQGVLSLNANGDNPVSVTATDVAGNESQEGTQTLSIDTSEPLPPIITSAELTGDTTPVITGMAEPGAKVRVEVGGATYELTATDGTWSLDLSTASAVTGTLVLNPNGANPISAIAIDAAGNASTAGTQTLVIDTAPPSAPVITSRSSTNQDTPVITGTAEPDAKVTVEVGGATYVVIATGGAWTLDLATAVATEGTLALDANGDNLVSVTATDEAGNESSEGTQTLVIDTTPPAAPAITSAALTNREAPVISGTAEAGATVTVVIGSATYTTVATGAAWLIDLSQAEPTDGVLSLNLNGDNAVSVTATDAAGNVSNPGTQTLAIDTTGPATVFSAVTFSDDAGTDDADFITNIALQTIEATLSVAPAVGDKVFGSVDGVTWIDITSSVTGTTLAWENVLLQTGEHTLRLKVSDALGNDSTVYSETYVLDVVVPTTVATAASFTLLEDTGAQSNDLITGTAQQSLSGELSTALQAGEFVEVSVDGGTTWSTAQATVGQNTWTAGDLTLLSGAHTFAVRVSDTAGNHGEAITRSYVLDTSAPQFSEASVNGTSLVLTYTDAISLDAVNLPATSAFEVIVAGAAVAVNAVAINATAGTVTLTLASAVRAGQAVTVAYTDPAGNDANAIQDVAGNDAATFAAVPVTNATPVPPVAPPVTPPASTPVDGVPVQVGIGADGQQQIVVPVVTPDRNEDTSTPNGRLADIAVVKNAAGVSLLNVGLPVGTGLTTNGPGTTVSATNAQSVLDGRITSASGTAEQQASAQAFLASLPADTQVVVQTVTVTAQAANGGPLVISAANTQDGHRTAVVVDTRSLPAGTLIDLENIDFAVIVGNARVTGGAGANIAYGDDDDQFIVLGEGDDVLHGQGGNDTVGSLRGNDRVFGDAGDDIVYGGSGDDTLTGGTGNDAMNGGFGFDTGVQSGARADYTVRTENGSVILTHRTSGEVDRFTDVERITFDSGRSIVVAHEASDVADLRARFGSDELIELNLTRAVPGSDANDVVTPTLGVALNIDLGAGQDVVKLAGGRDDVHLDVEAGQVVHLTRLEDGAMLGLKNVELLEFANGDVTVLAQNHDQAIVGRAYELLLGRNVDVAGFQFWAEALDAGVSLQSVLQLMVTSQEAADVYKLANGNFIEQLYVQGLDRASDAAGKAYWADALASGVSRAVVLEGFAGSAEAVEVIGSTVDVNTL